MEKLRRIAAEAKDVFCSFWGYIHVFRLFTLANDHTTLNTPLLVRSAKLSNVGSSQYLDGWPPGNTRCCWLEVFILILVCEDKLFTKKKKETSQIYNKNRYRFSVVVIARHVCFLGRYCVMICAYFIVLTSNDSKCEKQSKKQVELTRVKTRKWHEYDMMFSKWCISYW